MSDADGITLIQSEFQLRKDQLRAERLYKACKDMDGLDRVRFNGLDYRFLRTENGQQLPLIAGGLLQEDVIGFIKKLQERWNKC